MLSDSYQGHQQQEQLEKQAAAAVRVVRIEGEGGLPGAIVVVLCSFVVERNELWIAYLSSTALTGGAWGTA